MVMCDGDCGKDVKCLAESIIFRLDNDCAKSGNVPGVIQSILKSVDDMVGTLGAMFGILLSVLVTALMKSLVNGRIRLNTSSYYATALASAVTSLKFTRMLEKGIEL